jgi:hypothetical protein
MHKFLLALAIFYSAVTAAGVVCPGSVVCRSEPGGVVCDSPDSDFPVKEIASTISGTFSFTEAQLETDGRALCLYSMPKGRGATIILASKSRLTAAKAEDWIAASGYKRCFRYAASRCQLNKS